MAKNELATNNEQLPEESKFYKGGLRKSPAENKRVANVAAMITNGESDAAIMEYLNEEYGINKRYGRRYITAALDYLFPNGLMAMRDEIMQRNATYLFQIIQIGLEDKRYLAQSNKAIAELNKMMGVGQGGTTIAVQTDPENNTSQVLIKFDGQ